MASLGLIPYAAQDELSKHREVSSFSDSESSCVTSAPQRGWHTGETCVLHSEVSCNEHVPQPYDGPSREAHCSDPLGNVPQSTSLFCAETDLFSGSSQRCEPSPSRSTAASVHLDLEAMIRSHRSQEDALRPNPGYLEAHASCAAAIAAPGNVLTPQMRMIVVSWMVEVADEFMLQPETLHLAVALLDRFLSAAAPQGVARSVLQLVAVACVMVAAKDLEVNHPTVEQLTAIAANCFTAQDLLRMERVLLDSLDFNLTNHTAFSFLHLYAQGLSGLPPPVAALAMYLLDLVLLDYLLLVFPPSQLAAGAVALAAYTHGHPALACATLHIAGYAPPDMEGCVSRLLQLHRNATCPAAPPVRELLAPLARKYAQESWCCAALCQPLLAVDPAWFD